MKLHYYRMRNADYSATFSDKFESLVLSVIPEEVLLTEDMACSLYESAHNRKPLDYVSLSKTSISEYLRLLQDKGFLRAFSGYELRNALKLPR